jgi:hypothetical protein
MCKFKQPVSDNYSKTTNMAEGKETEVLDNFPLFATAHNLRDTSQTKATERNNYRSNNVRNKSTPIWPQNTCAFCTVLKFSQKNESGLVTGENTKDLSVKSSGS